jgi:hypothetical protein
MAPPIDARTSAFVETILVHQFPVYLFDISKKAGTRYLENGSTKRRPIQKSRRLAIQAIRKRDCY